MVNIEETLRAFFKALDQKDFTSMLKTLDAKAEGSDEITKKWIRGRKAFAAYAKRIEPEISALNSRIYGLHTRRVGAVGLATYNLKQSYSLSGRRHKLDFVMSTVLVKRGTGWKVSLIHMTPVGRA